MQAVYVGPLKEEAKKNLKNFLGDPFGVFKEYYEIDSYHVPGEWREYLGDDTKMDWGSWLYICDRETFRKMCGITNLHLSAVNPDSRAESRVTRMPIGDFAQSLDSDWYGVLEAELW